MKRKRKSYNQQRKRRLARWRDNNDKRKSVFTWAKIPWGKEKRTYLIFDDKTGNYISNKLSSFLSSTPKTKSAEYAYRFTDIDYIIRILNQIKHTGAWRTIRVK